MWLKLENKEENDKNLRCGNEQEDYLGKLSSHINVLIFNSKAMRI